jgi:hypothetical protein
MAAADVFLVIVLILFPPIFVCGCCFWFAHRVSRRPKVVIVNQNYNPQDDDLELDQDDYRELRRNRDRDRDRDRA